MFILSINYFKTDVVMPIISNLDNLASKFYPKTTFQTVLRVKKRSCAGALKLRRPDQNIKNNATAKLSEKIITHQA